MNLKAEADNYMISETVDSLNKYQQLSVFFYRLYGSRVFVYLLLQLSLLLIGLYVLGGSGLDALLQKLQLPVGYAVAFAFYSFQELRSVPITLLSLLHRSYYF